MRAPPPIRDSTSKKLSVCLIKLRGICKCHCLRRRWHVHKLKKARGEFDSGLLSPSSGPRVENMVNIPTGLLQKSAKLKPLMIASFPSGCARSPRVKMLRKNNLSRILLSKRKYKLKYYENDIVWEKYIQLDKQRTNGRSNKAIYNCAYTVKTIKKVTSKHADLRIIFHGSNTLKKHNLSCQHEHDNSPQYMEFNHIFSLRLKDFESLRSTKRFSAKASSKEIMPLGNNSKLKLATFYESEPIPNLESNNSMRVKTVMYNPQVLTSRHMQESILISYSNLT